MGIRSQKVEAAALLRNRDRTALLEWAKSVRSPFRVLMSMTYDRDELARWRAIEAIGWVVAAYSESDVEKVRDMLRRLLWQMNDESGGLAWHSPELIGEILVNVPVLIPEYADLLPSFLKEEPFERGTHFAIYRTASVDPRPFREIVPALENSLGDPDPLIRCYAALAVQAIDSGSCRKEIEELQGDSAVVRLFDFVTGRFHETTVGGATRQTIGEIGSPDRAA